MQFILELNLKLLIVYFGSYPINRQLELQEI